MGSQAGFGRPGKASEAARTVEIRMLDTLRFDPADVAVRKGETVTFRVTNAGTLVHEFDLGNQKFQDAHEKEMQGMGSEHHMGDEPNAVSVPPGKTKTVTWTFSDAGTGIYACHVAGHYAGGMKGTVTVA